MLLAHWVLLGLRHEIPYEGIRDLVVRRGAHLLEFLAHLDAVVAQAFALTIIDTRRVVTRSIGLPFRGLHQYEVFCCRVGGLVSKHTHLIEEQKDKLYNTAKYLQQRAQALALCPDKHCHSRRDTLRRTIFVLETALFKRKVCFHLDFGSLARGQRQVLFDHDFPENMLDNNCERLNAGTGLERVS